MDFQWATSKEPSESDTRPNSVAWRSSYLRTAFSAYTYVPKYRIVARSLSLSWPFQGIADPSSMNAHTAGYKSACRSKNCYCFGCFLVSLSLICLFSEKLAAKTQRLPGSIVNSPLSNTQTPHRPVACNFVFAPSLCRIHTIHETVCVVVAPHYVGVGRVITAPCLGCHVVAAPSGPLLG